MCQSKRKAAILSSPLQHQATHAQGAHCAQSAAPVRYFSGESEDCARSKPLGSETQVCQFRTKLSGLAGLQERYKGSSFSGDTVHSRLAMDGAFCVAIRWFGRLGMAAVNCVCMCTFSLLVTHRRRSGDSECDAASN